MNKFVIALLPLLATANAGIYSATWPEGEVDAKLILRSGHIGLQGVDSATHNPGAYVPQLRSDLMEEPSNTDLKKDEEKDPLKATQEPNNAEDTGPVRSQFGLRSDLPQYVNIGHMQNRPPIAWESWRYQPKRVRSVIIEETEAKPTGIVESPEAPASTARTPEENSEPKPAAIVETPEASVPASKPVENIEQIADNKEQLRFGYIVPTYNYYGSIQPIRLRPSYQSASAVAQNAPGINFAASSANTQGLDNGAAISQAVNVDGLQSAVSSANNNQGSTVAAAQNYGRQSWSVAQAYNNRGRIKYVAPQYQSATAFATNH